MRLRLIILLVIGLSFQSCTRKEKLPQEFFGYKLKKKITGSEAVQMVNRLHLQPVTDTKNEIGFYTRGDKQATIYITYYQSEKDAQSDLSKMINKISPENSVFINGGQVEYNHVLAHRYFGMGQTHFIFRYEKMLIWISVNTMIATEFLHSYIEFLR